MLNARLKEAVTARFGYYTTSKKEKNVYNVIEMLLCKELFIAAIKVASLIRHK